MSFFFFFFTNYYTQLITHTNPDTYHFSPRHSSPHTARHTMCHTESCKAVRMYGWKRCKSYATNSARYDHN